MAALLPARVACFRTNISYSLYYRARLLEMNNAEGVCFAITSLKSRSMSNDFAPLFRLSFGLESSWIVLARSAGYWWHSNADRWTNFYWSPRTRISFFAQGFKFRSYILANRAALCRPPFTSHFLIFSSTERRRPFPHWTWHFTETCVDFRQLTIEKFD